MPDTAATIHASVVIEGDVALADDVVVGPNCVIDGTIGPIRVGAGCRLIANCYLTGPLTLGEGNRLWPNVSLGTPPQDVGTDPDKPGAGLLIGSRNVFREGFTAHRAKTDIPTRIGDDNYFMSCSHVGHDSQVGNHIQLANGSLLAGHVSMGDKVIMGGGAGVHQFCRVGAGVFFRGLAGASMDVPPWCIVIEINRIAGLNLVGMRRSGMSSEELQRRRSVFRLMYRQGLSMASVVKQLRADGDAIAIEYADFVESSKRGVCHTRDRSARPSK
jgi:UDP-N-acetylglucosamine acyltransferase